MTICSDKRDAILVVVGEPSGDRMAARVVERVEKKWPNRCFGLGGDRLAETGMELLAHIDPLTALGIGDVALRLNRWIRIWADIRSKIIESPPRVALLVDSPDINLPLARILTAAGTKVVYYVGPQVWAWRKHRLAQLKVRADVTALILPFEHSIYRAHGVPSVFVGHPLLDEPPPVPGHAVRRKLGLDARTPLVALLPGSRPGEIRRHMDAMTKAGRALTKKGIRTVIAPYGTKVAGLTARDLLGAAEAAIVTSGTATLEAAIFGTPLAVVYRTGPVSALWARHLVKPPYIGLPNWVAGRKIVPEIVQGAFTGEALFEQAMALLQPSEQARQRRELGKVRDLLGGPGAADRVAALVLRRLA
jgi:lipid-A-disaccharide synthase